MHRLLALSLIFAVTNLGSAQESDQEKTSYMIGFQIGTGLVDLKDEVIMDMLVKGLEASIHEKEPAISMKEMQALSQALSTKMRAGQEARERCHRT